MKGKRTRQEAERELKGSVDPRELQHPTTRTGAARHAGLRAIARSKGIPVDELEESHKSTRGRQITHASGYRKGRGLRGAHAKAKDRSRRRRGPGAMSHQAG